MMASPQARLSRTGSFAAAKPSNNAPFTRQLSHGNRARSNSHGTSYNSGSPLGRRRSGSKAVGRTNSFAMSDRGVASGSPPASAQPAHAPASPSSTSRRYSHSHMARDLGDTSPTSHNGSRWSVLSLKPSVANPKESSTSPPTISQSVHARDRHGSSNSVGSDKETTAVASPASIASGAFPGTHGSVCQPTEEDAVKLLMQLDPGQRNRVMALVANPYKVTVSKGRDESLGVVCDHNTLNMVDVVPNSPADAHGVAHFAGRAIHNANGVPLRSLADLRKVSQNEPAVTLFFSPNSGSCNAHQDPQSNETPDDVSFAPALSASKPGTLSNSSARSLMRATSSSFTQQGRQPLGETLGDSLRSVRNTLQEWSATHASLKDSLALATTDVDVDRGNVLGVGSYGKVFRGCYERTDVAVKVMKKRRCDGGSSPAGSPRSSAALKRARLTTSSDETEVYRSHIEDWRNEVHIMSHLHHPNVLLLIGACFDAPDLFIVTELCEKGTLRSHLRKREPLPWETKISWLIQIAQGMGHLHHRGVQHRDLKPSNVFVTAGGVLKIADFGLSHREGITKKGADKGGRDPDSGRRAGGDESEAHIPGTFAFIAPEVWAEEPYRKASDVYSLGVTMVEIVSYAVPFDKAQPEDCSWMIMTGRARVALPKELPIPRSLRDISQRALAFEPGPRPSMPGLVTLLSQELNQPYATSRCPIPTPTQTLSLYTENEVHPKCAHWG